MLFFLFSCSISECPLSRITENTSGNVNISGCVFNNMGTSGKGSVIYLLISTSVFMEVKATIFSSCYGGSGAGAIYFVCSNGASELSKVCAYNCTVISGEIHYSAAFAYITTSASGSNNVDYFSIVKSRGLISPIEVLKGIQNHQGINSSNNYMTYYAGLGLQQSSDCQFRYSSISSNYATYHVIICFYKYLQVISSNVNFCNNSQGVVNSWGLIANYITSLTHIYQWVFYSNNRLTYLFAQQEGTCLVNNCVVDYNYACYGIIVSTPASYSNTFSLFLLNENDCQLDLYTKLSKIKIRSTLLTYAHFLLIL